MIRLTDNSFALIDELEYFKSTYSNAGKNLIRPKPVFYEINTQFLMDSQCQSKSQLSLNKRLRKRKKRKILKLLNSCPNEQNGKYAFDQPFFFANSTDSIIEAKNLTNLTTYVIPTNCRFVNADVRIIRHLVYQNAKFDLIVMDPPWPNKTVKRQKSYCLFNDVSDLIELPIKSLLSDNGLLCIWLSNNETVHSKTRKMLVKNWNFVELATWHWLKVCKQNYNPVVNFSPKHKVPFESMVLACHKDYEHNFAQISVMKNYVLIGTPNANPSRKPPIQPILAQLNLFKSDNTLELFARYLMPKTTSVGYEVLKFQDIYFFEK